jgi:zinc transport system substrate-binding protein
VSLRRWFHGPALTAAVLGALALMAAGCARESAEKSRRAVPSEAAAVSVCVSIPPQAFFVERIGGDRVSVEVLVKPGHSPATYEPTPAQMATLDRADVYFRIGMPFEGTLMDRISASMPGLNVVDLRRGIELQPIGGHDHEEGHQHGRLDPHTWLDPDLAAVQSRTIHDELVRLDPDRTAMYAANLEDLLTDLEEVKRDLSEMLAPVVERRMVVFHPAFGYFARACGLEQVPIEIQGKEPAPRELQHVIDLAEEQDLRAIFVQPQFSDTSARALAAAVDAEIIELDPLARDYLSNLREMARRIRGGLTGDEP